MKLKQLITGGALAATVLTIGSAQAEERNPYDGIVFCRATVTKATGQNDISVTLPFTTTGKDGQKYTFWNLGEVAAGGVADSWHGEGGPGRFVAHNNGHAGAYIYLTSCKNDWNISPDDGMAECRSKYSTSWGGCPGNVSFLQDNNLLKVDIADYGLVPSPTSSLRAWRASAGEGPLYCLAISRDVTAKIPTWHMLNRYLADAQWVVNENVEGSGYIGAYMGYLEAGEYMPFDVKIWMPRFFENYPMTFTFKVEAASFPLWEHDIEVK